MIDSYKGVRDFYPEDQRVQNYMFAGIRRAVKSYGYEEYNASILEATELYTEKTSDEIVNEQTYTFTDRGGRSVTLRPEMTPTAARMVGARRRELGTPLRWYSIPNLFRYERPQRGRLREHWQLNVDLFGVPGPEGDEEMIVLAHRVMRELGATDDMFQIRINDRNLLKKSIEEKLFDPARYPEAVRLIDKRDKLAPEAFAAAWAEICPLPLDECLTSDESVDALIATLKARGVTNAVFWPTLARGFDYYTGTVFEVFDLDPKNPRSIAGGGRYDKLIEGYGGEPTAAVGYGLGDVVLRDFLETHHCMPTLTPNTQLYLAGVGNPSEIHTVADTLRAQGINVAVGMKHEKLADHIRNADKLGIPYFAAFGEEEQRSKEMSLKHLASGTETKVLLTNVRDFFSQQH